MQVIKKRSGYRLNLADSEFEALSLMVELGQEQALIQQASLSMSGRQAIHRAPFTGDGVVLALTDDRRDAPARKSPSSITGTKALAAYRAGKAVMPAKTAKAIAAAETAAKAAKQAKAAPPVAPTKAAKPGKAAPPPAPSKAAKAAPPPAPTKAAKQPALTKPAKQAAEANAVTKRGRGRPPRMAA